MVTPRVRRAAEKEATGYRPVLRNEPIFQPPAARVTETHAAPPPVLRNEPILRHDVPPPHPFSAPNSLPRRPAARGSNSLP